MNIWQCDQQNCDRYVIGCGSAIGLRAIGWYFERGPVIYCPEHHPNDGINGAESSARTPQIIIGAKEL